MFPNLIQKAYAASLPTEATALIQGILDNIVNPLVTLMVAVAVVYFLWGVLGFVRNADNPEERKKGGMNMLWGAVGLFLITTAYGVLNLILGTIGK